MVGVARSCQPHDLDDGRAAQRGDADVEGFFKSAGQSMYPKLMRRARAKAMSLGLEWKEDFADGMCAERKQRPMPVKEPEPSEDEAAEGEEEAAAE